MMHVVLMVVHVLLAAALIVLILMQHGRGADAGAAFGSGASGTVFGARGVGSFLTRATAICATFFFLTSLSLAYLTTGAVTVKSVTDIERTAEEAVPAAAPDMPNAPQPQLPVAPAAPSDALPGVPEPLVPVAP